MENVIHLERRPDEPRRAPYWKLGPNHELVPCDDVLEFGQWFETADRHVAKTNIAGYWVSTVFLGIDHGYGKGRPVLFETMTFGPDGDEYTCVRYSTWDSAALGHARTVAEIKRERWRRPHAYVWRLIRRAYTSAVLHVSRMRWLMEARRRAQGHD